MCGIAGLMSVDGTPPSVEILRAMADAIAHRGPDGRGEYNVADVALLQNRLAIIDLETGDQPLFAAKDGDTSELALVANGEIYN